VLKVSGDGASLMYSSYLDGTGDDYGAGIAVDSSGDTYVAGSTASANFPTASFDDTLDGGQDAFLAKVSAQVPVGGTCTLGALMCPGSLETTRTIRAQTARQDWLPSPT